jgi:hypothetical protein
VEWLDELAMASLGNVTRDELGRFVDGKRIDRMVAAGQLINEFRGVYRTAGAPRSFPQRVVAACKAVGPDCFPSHGTAARLRLMRYVPAGRIELTAPRRVRLPGVKVYESNLVLPSHVEYHSAVNRRVATAARTVNDLAVRLSEETLRKVVDTARWDRLLTYDTVWEVRNHLRARGRRRTTALDALLARRIPGLERDDSSGELMLLGWLLTAGLPTPVQQHWVVVNGMRYRCDLAYPAERIDVEWDPFSTHGQDRGTFAHDRLRDDDFDAAGWRVVRVTDEWTSERAIAAVRRALSRAA